MTGHPDLNRAAFHVAAAMLRKHGYHVISPAELCTRNHNHVASLKPHPCGRKDLQALVSFPIDGLATLPDGPEMDPPAAFSKGMRIERYLAEQSLKIPVEPLAYWLNLHPVSGLPLVSTELTW